MSTTDDNNMSALLGAVMGALPPARSYLVGLQEDIDANARNNRKLAISLDGVSGKVNLFLSRGDTLRGMFPVVQDFQSGLVTPYMAAKNANVLAVVATTDPPPLVAAERDVVTGLTGLLGYYQMLGERRAKLPFEAAAMVRAVLSATPAEISDVSMTFGGSAPKRSLIVRERTVERRASGEEEIRRK